MSFAIYLAGIMQPFLLRFQLKKPVIHLLYDGCGQLLFDIMTNFVKRESLLGENKKRLEVEDLGQLNVKRSSLQMPTDNINPGTEARYLFLFLLLFVYVKN